MSGGPHLDYHQNDTERVLFHREHEKMVAFDDILMGESDAEDDRLTAVPGV